MIKKTKGYFKVDRGFFDLRLKPHTAMVYLYLLSSINKDTRQCWPSMKTIARKLDISKSTVEKAIVELAQKHLIIKSNRSRDSRIISNLYTLPDGVGYYHKKGMDEFVDTVPPDLDEGDATGRDGQEINKQKELKDNYLNKPSDYKNFDFKPNNIVMVSENPDKITRGYADLTPIKVLYKDNEKKELLDKIISKNMVENMESLYVRTGEKNENEYINAAVSTFVPICKNKYFEHEEEARLLFFPSKQTKIQYREKNGRLLPFIKCYVVHKNSEKYPIRSITIGPGYNQNLVFNAIINLIEGENCVFFSEDTCNMILNDNSKCALDFESLKDNKTKKGLYFYKNTDDEKVLVYVTSCGICIRKSSIPFRD